MLKEEGPYVIASRKLTTFFFIIKAVLRLRTAMVRFRVGYSRVSSFAGSGSGMISHPRFSGSGPEIYWVWFFTNGYPMDQIIVYNKNSCFIVYLIKLYLFKLLNLF